MYFSMDIELIPNMLYKVSIKEFYKQPDQGEELTKMLYISHIFLDFLNTLNFWIIFEKLKNINKLIHKTNKPFGKAFCRKGTL